MVIKWWLAKYGPAFDPSTLPVTSGQGVPESLCHLIYSVRRDAEHAVDVERMVLRAVGVVKLRNEG